MAKYYPEECAICMEHFEQGDTLAGHEIKETQTKVNKFAGHVFHKNCLQKWLKGKNQCPLDRQRINGLPTDMRPNNAQARPNNAEHRNENYRQIIQLIEEYNSTEDPNTKAQLKSQIRNLGNQRVYVGRIPMPMHRTVLYIHGYHEHGEPLPYQGFDRQIRVSTETLNTLIEVMRPRREQRQGILLSEFPGPYNLGERNVRRRNVNNMLPAQQAGNQARGGGNRITRLFRTIFGCFLGR